MTMLKPSSKLSLGAALFAPALLLAANNATAANLTDETRKALKKNNIPASLMEGLDAELKLPKYLIDAARKEGKVRVRMTMQNRAFANLQKMFNARYPNIKVEYFRGVGNERALVPLLAFRQGKYVSDIVSSIGVLLTKYQKVNALADISDLPAYHTAPLNLSGSEGKAIAYRIQNYCMTYSTERVKKSDLPKTWDDLLNNPKFHNGKIGMATNANTWLALFAGKFGNEWANNYMDKLFAVAKPQLRKERLNAISKLASLGEFDIAIPQSESQAKNAVVRGLKIGFHCPDPVAVNGTVMAVLKGTPNENAAKVWVNWILSREGQLGHFTYDFTGPSHKDLRPLKNFSSFPEAVIPTPKAYLDRKALANMPVVMKRWQRKWVSFGGPSRKRGKRGKRKPR